MKSTAAPNTHLLPHAAGPGFPDEEDLMTAKELATELRAPISSIYMWERTRVLPSVRTGGSMRFSRVMVMSLLEDRIKRRMDRNARATTKASPRGKTSGWASKFQLPGCPQDQRTGITMAAFDPAELDFHSLATLMSVYSDLLLVPLVTEAALPKRIARHPAQVSLVVLSARQVSTTLGPLLQVYAVAHLEPPVIVVVVQPDWLQEVMAGLPKGVPVILCPPVWTDACYHLIARALSHAKGG